MINLSLPKVINQTTEKEWQTYYPKYYIFLEDGHLLEEQDIDIYSRLNTKLPTM